MSPSLDGNFKMSLRHLIPVFTHIVRINELYQLQQRLEPRQASCLTFSHMKESNALLTRPRTSKPWSGERKCMSAAPRQKYAILQTESVPGVQRSSPRRPG